MDLITIPLGVRPPVALRFTITDVVVDLTTVFAVTLSAINESVIGYIPKSWNALLIPAAGQVAVLPGLAQVAYPLQVNDIDSKGIWKAQVLLAVTGGTWPGDPAQTVTWRVTDQWGRP